MRPETERPAPAARNAPASAPDPERATGPAAAAPAAPDAARTAGPAPAPATAISRDFPAGITERRAWVTLFVLVLGQMASALNQTTMTSSLAVIMGEFGISANLGQWLTTAYIMFMGITMPLSAHLMTKYRTRPLFVAALGVFFAGALVGALQHDFRVLVAARCIQACGSGVVIPLVQVVAFRMFPYQRRGEATGVAAMAVALAPAFGPTLAGILTDTVGWRWIFTISAGMALVSAALAWVLLRRVPEAPQPHRLDVPSFLLSTVMAAGVVCGCSDMGTFGVLSVPALAPLGAGLAAGALFVRRQLRVAQPLLDVRALACAPFAVACCAVMLIQGMVYAINNFVCLYVQDVQGYSATLGGLTMLPGALVMMALTPLAGRALDHHGPLRVACAGFAMLVAGTLLLSTLTVEAPLWEPVAFQTLRYAGVACLNQMLLTWGINRLAVSRTRSGTGTADEAYTQGTATANSVRQIGAAATNALLFSVMDLRALSIGEGPALAATFGTMGCLQLGVAAVVLGFMAVSGTGGVRGPRAGRRA